VPGYHIEYPKLSLPLPLSLSLGRLSLGVLVIPATLSRNCDVLPSLLPACHAWNAARISRRVIGLLALAFSRTVLVVALPRRS